MSSIINIGLLPSLKTNIVGLSLYVVMASANVTTDKKVVYWYIELNMSMPGILVREELLKAIFTLGCIIVVSHGSSLPNLTDCVNKCGVRRSSSNALG